jgi:hypothetical protein
MPTRATYWTCSKFADWIRGTAKPKAETSQGWREWRKEAEKQNPIRYWIAEEGLDHLQDIWLWIPDKLNDIRYYINNRWIIRSHACTAHPSDIKPGDWCDVGNRFLPCLFNELVDFVEVETAWHTCIWDEEARKKFQPPWWQKRWFFRWGQQWRCPEAGMSHLVWASGLKDDNGGFTQQALNAKEIIDLYVWWKHIRPKRPDPMDASGWSDVCEQRRKKNGDDIFWDDNDPQDVADSRTALDKCHELEQQYENEDEEMMIRLIKVRHGLWT